MKPLFAAAVLALAACMSDTTAPSDRPPVAAPEQPPQQGGGSDTETLTGMVATLDGLPAARIPVKLLPAGYDPSRPDTALIRRAITDENGAYRFEGVDTARLWNVIAGDVASRSWALARDLRPGGPAAIVTLGPAKVLLVTLHVGGYVTSDSGIAYFPGTDILARCDARSVSRLDSVPAAATRFVIESRAGWKYDTTLAAAGDTTRVRADRTQILITP